jgi:hypothetical protein
MTDVLHREPTTLWTTLTVRLQVVSANSGRPLHGCPVRLWRCDESRPANTEVRISDRHGWTEFDRALPADADGHWPHMHFDIHGRVGRLALPGSCAQAYGESGFCADQGEPLMIASVTGDARRGLVATRTLKVG